MPAFTFPIKWRTLYASGDVLLWAELYLLLKDSSGGWQRELFLVDSGTEMTTMPTEYVFPCFFVGDPAGPMPVNPLGDPVPNLLGLTGVINQLRLTFDGDSSPTAPYGNLIVEKI